MHIRPSVLCLLSFWIGFLCLGANADDDPLAAVEKARLSGDKKLEMQLLEPLVLGNQSGNPRALLYYAVLLRDERRFDDARVHCKKAMELAPRDQWVWQSARSLLNDLKEPSPIANSSTKGGRIGFVGIRFHNQKVLQIIPGSPAERACIAAGDVIVSYNGVSAKGQSDETMHKGMRGLEGTPLKLIVERAGKKYSCSIVRGHAIYQDYSEPTEIRPVPPPLGNGK